MRETCEQRYKRLLREGWKCLYLADYHALMLGSSGVRETIDLRKDTVTLRPNGDVSVQHELVGEGLTYNYEAVDEETPDDDSTKVRNTFGGTGTQTCEDRYDIEYDSALNGASISNVRVCYRRRRYVQHENQDEIRWKCLVRSGSTTDYETQNTYQGQDDNWYDNSPVDWANNPDDGQPWEDTDIQSLQIGIWSESYRVSSCVLPEARIWLADGTYKEARGLVGGDEVMSFNLEKRRYERCAVGDISHVDEEVWTVIINDSWEITDIHPVYCLNRQAFVKARELAVGDILLDFRLRGISIRNIRKRTARLDRYDISLESKPHNFFADGVLVHNILSTTFEMTQQYVVVTYTPGPTETIVAMDFPMKYYQTTGVKELRSKVSGAAVTKVANDFPPVLIESGDAQELGSKWS